MTVGGIRKHLVSTPEKIIDSVKDHQSLMGTKVIHRRFAGKDISKVPKVSPRNHLLIRKEKQKPKKNKNKKIKVLTMEQRNPNQFIKHSIVSSETSETLLRECGRISHGQRYL